MCLYKGKLLLHWVDAGGGLEVQNSHKETINMNTKMKSNFNSKFNSFAKV